MLKDERGHVNVKSHKGKQKVNSAIGNSPVGLAS